LKRSLPLVVAAIILLNSHSFGFAQNLDLILRGGSLIDGSGSPSAKADVGIKGDRIVFIGAGASRKAKRCDRQGAKRWMLRTLRTKRRLCCGLFAE